MTVHLKVGEQTKSSDIRTRLAALLREDLDFHDEDSGYASHNFHSFPAKFPPQLPRRFIEGLTTIGEVVLDPMVGSGTTAVEAFLAGRQAVGFDIDPLALMMSEVKVTAIDPRQASDTGAMLLKRARKAVEEGRRELEVELEKRWDTPTQRFVNYWFAPDTQVELQALVTEIEKVPDKALRTFFLLALSAIIITKSGGVSLAFDLGHTRPHRARIVKSRDGRVLLGEDRARNPDVRSRLLTKTLRSSLDDFGKRLERNLGGLGTIPPGGVEPRVGFGNAQNLPVDDETVDLIVTSPPYPSNAIDYMRAHKFSLVWMGYPIGDLGQKRKEYIGSEAVMEFDFTQLPKATSEVVASISRLDARKGRALHRYYSEMTRTMQEMYRVLKPGKAAVVVVGSSVVRGRDTETGSCLADIGRQVGFDVPKMGVRGLDRDRRMLPAGLRVDSTSQIQQRMHEECVVGFYKPGTNGRHAIREV